jgi:hypothetical protein
MLTDTETAALAALLRKHGAGALLGALSGIAAAIATDPALDSS